tara:strand:- start:985 stop:1755 length:771 start_codon:yes stop_codon:yes gene_type:complete
MIKKRIIPTLLLQNDELVKTKNFKIPQYIGDPINTVGIFNDLAVDELIIQDISIDNLKNENINFKTLKSLASECFMPLSYGGGIKSLRDAEKIFKVGFEKIIINTASFLDISFLSRLIKNFGSQSIIHSIDVKKNLFHKYIIYTNSGKKKINVPLDQWLQKINEIEVGEVIITNIDKEGTWSGFDFNLVRYVSEMMTMPVIANGGCGSKEHLKKIFKLTTVSAAAVGSMFLYQKQNMGVLVNYLDENEITEIFNEL